MIKVPLAEAGFTPGAWEPAQNSVAFKHWVLQEPKYHLVPMYKVEPCSLAPALHAP